MPGKWNCIPNSTFTAYTHCKTLCPNDDAYMYIAGMAIADLRSKSKEKLQIVSLPTKPSS
jgi:hypothetical protein